MIKKIYLDYQATTPVDAKILKKMLPYFTENFGNPHSNNHSVGRLANEAVEESRKNVANLINAETSEIIFTSSGTEANNTIFQCAVNDLRLSLIIYTPTDKGFVKTC